MRGWTAMSSAVLLVAVAAGTRAAGEETYTGTVALAQGGAAPAPVTLTLTIRQYTSDARANELAQLLHDRGHDAAVKALAPDDVGQLVLGDATYRVTLVRQEPTASGRILRAVTDRPLDAASKPAAAVPPADAVGYLELTLGAGDAGEGRLIPAVKAQFDAEGFVAPENVGAAPATVSGVKRKP